MKIKKHILFLFCSLCIGSNYAATPDQVNLEKDTSPVFDGQGAVIVDTSPQSEDLKAFNSFRGNQPVTLSDSVLTLPHYTDTFKKNREERLNALVKVLPHFHALEHLDVLDSAINAQGARALSAVLPQTLTELNLSWKSIGNEGVQDLAHALSRLPNLEKLRLSRIDMDDEGAKILASTLKNLPKLTFIDVSGNTIGEEGINALIHSLPQENTDLYYDQSF